MTTPACAPGAKALAAVLLLSVLGCSSEPTTTAAVEPSAAAQSVRTVSTSQMQRVIVTLKPTGPTEKDAVDQAVQRLASAFPDAKVVRTMPGFSQMVIDLPADQLKALSADPMVASTSLEARYSTQPIDQVPQER